MRYDGVVEVWSGGMMGPPRLDAKGVNPTSPGKETVFGDRSPTACLTGGHSVPLTRPMRQAFSLRTCPRANDPRALPWAGINDAFGVVPSIHQSINPSIH